MEQSLKRIGNSDQVLIVVIRDHFPVLFGDIGVCLVALILITIMASAMSSADSNLHALSAVVTRDGFDQLKPGSSETTKVWVGRMTIVVATLLSWTVFPWRTAFLFWPAPNDFSVFSACDGVFRSIAACCF